MPWQQYKKLPLSSLKLDSITKVSAKNCWGNSCSNEVSFPWLGHWNSPAFLESQDDILPPLQEAKRDKIIWNFLSPSQQLGQKGWGREGEAGDLTLTSLTMGGLLCNQGLAPNPWEQSCLKPDFSALVKPIGFPLCSILVWRASEG